MHKTRNRVLVFAVVAGMSSAAAGERASVEQVNGWIKQLSSAEFAEREMATEQLIEAGLPAINPLGDAIGEGDLEATIRGLQVLLELALSDDEATEDAAREVLEQIAADDKSRARSRAKNTLAAANARRQDRAIEALRKLGAEVNHYETNLFVGGVLQATTRYTVTIDDTWQGEERGLKYLRWLPDLYMVTLSGKQVEDGWLLSLNGLESIQYVELNRTEVRGPGIEHLANLPVLQRLTIKYSPIADDSLERLKQLKTPSLLMLYGTKISPEAADNLKQALAAANVDVDYRRGAFLGVGCTQTDDGCMISQVHPGSGAQKAELRVGDIVVSYNEVPVADFNKLTELIGQQVGGDTATIVVRRRGEELSKEVTLGEWE